MTIEGKGKRNFNIKLLRTHVFKGGRVQEKSLLMIVDRIYV